MGGTSIELGQPNNPFSLYLIKNIIIPRKGKKEKHTEPTRNYTDLLFSKDHKRSWSLVVFSIKPAEDFTCP
jgi:hypothetical protein